MKGHASSWRDENYKQYPTITSHIEEGLEAAVNQETIIYYVLCTLSLHHPVLFSESFIRKLAIKSFLTEWMRVTFTTPLTHIQ